MLTKQVIVEDEFVDDIVITIYDIQYERNTIHLFRILPFVVPVEI